MNQSARSLGSDTVFSYLKMRSSPARIAFVLQNVMQMQIVAVNYVYGLHIYNWYIWHSFLNAYIKQISSWILAKVLMDINIYVHNMCKKFKAIK